MGTSNNGPRGQVRSRMRSKAGSMNGGGGIEDMEV